MKRNKVWAKYKRDKMNKKNNKKKKSFSSSLWHLIFEKSTTFSQQIISGKLLLVLILIHPLITASNNLPFKICCENVIDITFL